MKKKNRLPTCSSLIIELSVVSLVDLKISAHALRVGPFFRPPTPWRKYLLVDIFEKNCVSCFDDAPVTLSHAAFVSGDRKLELSHVCRTMEAKPGDLGGNGE